MAEKQPGNGNLSSSTELNDHNQAAGFEILENFQSFNQRNDVFSCSFWDPTPKTTPKIGCLAWLWFPQTIQLMVDWPIGR